VVAWLGLVAAIGLLAFLILQHTGTPQARSASNPAAPTHAAAAPRPAAPTTAPKRTPVAAAPTQRVRLVLTATRTSWLEVRTSSATGPVVFAGNLEAGRTIRATGGRLWARFGAAANLTITANGKRVPLMGTIEHTFRPAAR